MQTKRAKILEFNEESVRIVVDSLLSGHVVGLPTETVYGLGGIITDENALHEIFRVKARPYIDPLIVHVLDLASLLSLVDVDEKTLRKIEKLADAFCPGPLTFVLNKKKHVSDIVTAGKKSVAVRMPAHKVFRSVLRELRCGIAAPSANLFGYLSPTTAQHVLDGIGDRIDYILDGGTCEFGVESTILDLSRETPKILRPGAITSQQISEVLSENIDPYRSFTSNDPSAPGMLKQHYSPNTKLRLFEENLPTHINKENAAVIYLSRENIGEKGDGDVYWLSENGDILEIARNIFALLRILDLKSYDIIYCQVPRNDGIGMAIRDRLGRAAAKFHY